MRIILQWIFEAPKEQEQPSRDAKLRELHTPGIPYAERPAGEPQYCGEAAVDIIAVHGLDSDPETGWARKLPDGSRYPWLREKLPKDMPDARILTFSYPSSFYGDPTYTSIEECARQLLRVIIRDRRHPGKLRMCPTRKKRPIVFLGHSFGGLVIKKALLIANEYVSDRTLHDTKEGLRERQNYLDIISAVGGLFFFGTPHKGSTFSRWAEMKMYVGSMCGQATFPDLIRLLGPHSLELHDMQRDFKRLYRGDKLTQALLYCYYEMKGVPLYPHIVVSKASACISDAQCRGFNLTHKELNKFKAGDDSNYDVVLTDLEYAVTKSAAHIAKTFTPGNYGTTGASEASKAVEVALKPATGQLDQLRTLLSHRRHTPKSCMWILSHHDFKRWASDSNRLDSFWVYGKGGAGKSVLAAYIIDWLRTDQGRAAGANFDSSGFPVCRLDKNKNACGYVKPKTTVLFFFFGVNRANQHVVSFLGTLVHQLLTIHYDNEQLFATARNFVDERVRNPGAMADEEAKFIKLLVDMLTLLGAPAYIIVDGVEENSEDDQGIACLRALARLKKQLSPPLNAKKNSRAQAEAMSNQAVRLHIMVVSQATSSISFAMQEVLPKRAEIDICRYTEDDIANFVQTKGDELMRQRPKLQDGRDKIVQSLTNGAQGVFQWVNGAFKLLEKYAGDVEGIDKWLGNLPPTLAQTWEKVFMRLPQGNEAVDAQRKIRLALKLLAVYARPLTATELYYAYTIGTIGFEEEDDGTFKTIDGEVKRLVRGREQFKDSRFAIEEIRGLLDSLVEFDIQKGTVKLVHDSVRQALLLPDDSERHPQSSATEQLRLAGYQFTGREAQAAAAELCMRIVQSSTLSHATSFATTPIPFVEYCWDHWKYHLKRSSVRPGVIVDQMIRGVSRDTIAFLGALTEFVGRDLPPVGGRYSDLEYILSLKRARECLLPAIEPLATIQKEPEGALSMALFGYEKLGVVEENGLPTTYKKCDEFVRRVYQRVRGRLMPKETTVTRLRIDALLEKPAYRKAILGSRGTAALLEAARNLRSVALRFAVNPVYSALISTAGGTTFSPIHPLVYVANLLEECGSAPFWDQLSSNWDPIDRFICNDDDPQAGPARFVLQCFAWRELQDQIPAAAEPNRQYMRAVSRLNAQPNPGGQQLLRASTENREQVKRLHGMSGAQYITSYVVLEIFGGGNEESFVKTFVYNPIGQHHIRSNLLLNKDGSYLDNMFEDPKKTLARHAPEALMEAPVTAAVEAIPSILKLAFVKYITLLFELFGNVASRAIATHAQQMMEVAQGIQLTLGHVDFLWQTASLASVLHLSLAVLMFLVRNIYFPSVAAHYLNNPMNRLRLAIKDPALYLQSQHDFSWWYWARAVSTSFIFNFLMGYLSTAGVGVTLVFRQMRASNPSYSGLAYLSEYTLIAVTSFVHLCTLQRHLTSVLYLLGTIVAGGYIMMHDQAKIYSILTFTVWYWFYTGLGILNNLIIAVSMAAFGPFGFLVVFVSWVPQYYLIKLVSRHQLAIAWVISWPFQPLVWAGRFAWVLFLHAYVHVLQICGIIVLCGLVLLSFHWFRQQVKDPYDIEGTVRKLRKAANLVKNTLKEAERKRIGEYPLGGEIEDQPQKNPASENASAATPQATASSASPGVTPAARPMNSHLPTATNSSTQSQEKTGEYVEQRFNNVQDPSASSSPPTASHPSSQASPDVDAEELFRQFFGSPSVAELLTKPQIRSERLREWLKSHPRPATPFTVKPHQTQPVQPPTQSSALPAQSNIVSPKEWMKGHPRPATPRVTPFTVKPHRTQPAQPPTQSSALPSQTQPVRPPPEPYVPPPRPPKPMVAPPRRVNVPSPPNDPPESSGTTPQATSTDVNTAAAPIPDFLNAQSLDDLLSLPGRETEGSTGVFKNPKVRRRTNRQFAVAS
ncbi:uncharacterized protein EI97DRAFT_459876 [Westerdykella ornata]|uniref:Nephrocystin 3-like N-terminal domain-containing protein n=1 Tax=Westerdykella ornata TaxID=318751 RepID=A0A6A6JFI6_WESOR|nr:uncharacterized protein EI97DRAFT_459876 [Westerdykella ornata]KAF2274923.1 hypothetical protein EI97DRAFT_459876 [Westerdykella ornata]